jgi:hypothetical protein
MSIPTLVIAGAQIAVRIIVVLFLGVSGRSSAGQSLIEVSDTREKYPRLQGL